jgi:hypothetical protein
MEPFSSFPSTLGLYAKQSNQPLLAAPQAILVCFGERPLEHGNVLPYVDDWKYSDHRRGSFLSMLEEITSLG